MRVDRRRGVVGVDAEPLAEARPSAAARGVDVEGHPAAEEPGRVEAAEDQVGVGDASARCRPARSRPGPGSLPADSGPTWSTPPASTWAIDPPPAPIAWMSTIGRPMQ